MAIIQLDQAPLLLTKFNFIVTSNLEAEPFLMQSMWRISLFDPLPKSLVGSSSAQESKPSQTIAF